MVRKNFRQGQGDDTHSKNVLELEEEWFHKKKLQWGVQDARRPRVAGVLGGVKKVFDKKRAKNQARASSRATATGLVRNHARPRLRP